MVSMRLPLGTLLQINERLLKELGLKTGNVLKKTYRSRQSTAFIRLRSNQNRINVFQDSDNC